MITAHDLVIDQCAPSVESGTRLTTWYAQGHSDGLGDRLLMFDNTSAPSWEILRFKQTLARNPIFDDALRQRVERLSAFHHPAFPLVRPIKELGHEDGLAIVSTYVSGVYLSEALKKPRNTEFAVRLIRQLVPALAALQEHTPDGAHGALTADRIILTAEGRLMIREYMVGSAIESLMLSAAELWAEFGILAAPTRKPFPMLDRRSDVTQLALVALSLMVGRRIGPDEYPGRVRGLLDEIAQRSRWQEPVMFQSLRHWLERALQLDDDGFDSAREASDALAEWQGEPERDDDYIEAALRQASAATTGPLPNVSASTLVVADENPGAATGVVVGGSRSADEVQVTSATGPVPIVRRRFGRPIVWAAVVVLAIGEAAFIGRWLYLESASRRAVGATAAIEPPQRPEADPAPSDQPVQATPSQSNGRPQTPSILPLPAVVVANMERRVPEIQTAREEAETPVKVNSRPAGSTRVPAAPPRSGGFRVSSPVEVHVLDGERVLGSSEDGPIIAPAGRHEFEFVNSLIGYRVRRVVDIKPGEITALPVTVPNGTLNINALPWAEVSIDGKAVGETPLGNLSVVPGEHEIVFRHPRLGERREKTIVRTGVSSRVAVDLQR